jgi:polysaccharide biosynthesis transport protein
MPPLPQYERSAGSEDWCITDCIRILRRRKAMVLWIICVAGILAALITCAQPRVYQARALVEVVALNENFLNLRNVYPAAASKLDPALYVQTQVELLQQDSLLEEVARKLRLGDRPEFQPRTALIANLRDDIQVLPLRNTRVIQLVCDARDASLASDLANTLARSFIEQGIETRQRAARQTYELLESQIEELRQGFPWQLGNLSAQALPRRPGSLPTRGAGASQYVYKTMLRQANDARTASLVRQSSLELVAPAEPPTRPQKPNLPLNLAIGILDGVVVAIGFVLLQEQNTRVLREPGEAENLLGLRELGAIPAQPEPRPEVLAAATHQPRAAGPVVEQAWLSQSEAFRSILTSILSGKEDHSRILVVTSSLASEGKTAIVRNLGRALAELGRKTLLIDGDPRHPQLHHGFDKSGGDQPGDTASNELLDETTREVPLETLVTKTTIPNLFLLRCEAQTDRMRGPFHSDELPNLFERLRREFDYVLLDMPPCREFSRARDLARCTDGLVLVVRASYASRRTVRAAVESLQNDGFRVMGIILNRWDPARRETWLPRLLRRTSGEI